MLDHFLRHLEIGDDAVAQRTDRLNVARRAPSINLASSPTASTCFLPRTLAIATTDGSFSTIPAPSHRRECLPCRDRSPYLRTASPTFSDHLIADLKSAGDSTAGPAIGRRSQTPHRYCIPEARARSLPIADAFASRQSAGAVDHCWGFGRTFPCRQGKNPLRGPKIASPGPKIN